MPRLVLIGAPGHPRHDEGEVVIDAPADTPVLDVALAHRFAIATLCGGGMSCRTCRVVDVDGRGLSEKSRAETRVLEVLGAAADERLSCQARVVSDARVRVPSPKDATS